MEGRNLNTTRRDPLATPRNTPEVLQLTREMNDLRDMVVNARQVPMMRGSYLVNRDQLLMVLDNIEHLLPASLRQAAAVIADEQKILGRAHTEAKAIADKAASDARKATDDANAAAKKTQEESRAAAEQAARDQANAKNAASTIKAQAESEAKAIREKAQADAQGIRAQAEREYGEIISRAQMEAGMIVRDAEQRAAAAVSEQNVYNMAVMAAKELREDTEQDMVNLRQHYVSGLNQLMASADDYLMSLVETIRQERANLINNG